MAESIHRIAAEVIAVTRTDGTDRISARVRLRYSLPDQRDAGAAEIVTRVVLNEEENPYWRRTRRKLVATAWQWLSRYFEGASLGSDLDNIFADVFPRTAAANATGLTPEQERSLQRELRAIEQEFAA